MGDPPRRLAMFHPTLMAQANAVLARGMAVRWRDFKVDALLSFRTLSVSFFLPPPRGNPGTLARDE